MSDICFHQKRSILSSLFFMFVLGSCLFSPELKTATAKDNHSGGFVIHSEKVDGTINIIAMLFGEVDISEGKIYGLTITKTLTTPQGNLIVKIKSPGPVPVSNLTGKTLGGLSLPKGICEPGKFGYICFEDVTMTLSEQQVDSIAIPNATIETCYEQDCPENKQEEVETLQASDAEVKTLEEINDELIGLHEQLTIVDDLLMKAKTIETTIRNEKQPEQIKKQIERLGKHLQDADALLSMANDISGWYNSFNENATEYGLISGVVEDILKQMSKLLKEHEQYVAELDEALHVFEGRDADSDNGPFDEKHRAYLQSLMNQFESEEDLNFTEVQKQIVDIKEKIKAKQSEAKDVEENRQLWNEQLSSFHTTIHHRGNAIAESEKFTDNEREKITSVLDVADPHKFIEKQIKDLVLQSEDPEIYEDLERLETFLSDVFKQLESSKLSIQHLEEIANLTEEIETALSSQPEGEGASQFQAIEKKLAELSELANMPEQMATTYKLTPLQDHEKHSFRVMMLDQIERWQQLPKIFSREIRDHQLEQIVEEFNGLKEQIANLKEKIEENLDELEIDGEFMSGEEADDDDGESLDRMVPILDRLISTPIPLPSEQGSHLNDVNESQSGEKSSNQSAENKSTHSETKPDKNKDKSPPVSSSPVQKQPPKQNELDDKRNQQLIDAALRQGQQHVNSIRKTTKQADGNLKKLEQTSTDLTRVILGRHAIKAIPSGEFDTNLRKLERHVNSLDNPVKQLRSSIDRASQLLDKQANANRELSELKATLQAVIVLKIRLENVRETLNTYPDYVVFVNTKRKNIDNVLKKFDPMLK
ncbi:hypothetical protein [Pueribacillus sp. YX66]|uniref:hypothetical protein n=1 Tax=Pueribacillus sp. YX66 TaxID=3229242 RepID=UPI00358CEA2E